MGLSEVPVEKFGGLDLLDDPGEIGAAAAVDLLNVDFDQLGRVKTRQGYTQFTTAAGDNRYDSLHTFGKTSGADILVAGAGHNIMSIIEGAVSKSQTANSAPHYFTSYGTATETRVYIANGVDPVIYYTDDSFTTPSYSDVTPTGKFLATQQPDNRLVVARTAANRSRVMFSDPGDPATFGTNNYVDLSPGDGEEITGLVAWREFVFAFKETKYYVFYGNDVDSTGSPIFNFRAVYGAGVRFGLTYAAGADGVYFMDRRGVYRTQGGNPTLVSRQIEPLFSPISNTSLDRIDGSSVALPEMHWADDRLYLAYATTGSTYNNRMLVYHTIDGWWSMWDVPAVALATARVAASDVLEESILFAYATGANHIGRFTNSPTDAGTSISSKYQFGYMDFGDSDRKVLHQVLLDGNGLLDVSVGVDYQDPDVTTRVALGNAPVVSRRRARHAYRGHNFSPKLEAVDGSAWRLNRLTCLVRSKNNEGIE